MTAASSGHVENPSAAAAGDAAQETIHHDATTLADLLRLRAAHRPDAIAFHFEGASVSFGELDRRSNYAANGLRAIGLQPNERVAYLGKNSDAYFEMLFAVAKAGGVTCPVNWRLAPAEIAYILNDAGARVLFVGPEFAETAKTLTAEVPSLEQIICTEPNDAGLAVLSDWREAYAGDDPKAARAESDDALQLYTSGTTGRPKGAIISNRGILESHIRYKDEPGPEWNKWTSDDVSLVAMPCFHIGGTAWGLTGVANGACGVIMREFDPTKVLDFMDAHKISKIFMVPAAMQIVVNQPRAKDVDFSRLKYMMYGASPIPLALLRQCMDVFQCGFVQMYGMTETSGTIVALPPEDHDPEGNERMRSAGKALTGVELAILDENGAPLPPRAVGEIATRSAANMTGYWNLPDATAATLSDDGWLRTGDAGYLDEDGFVYIHDRVKDMIITGGENVYPAEVENALYEHADIADVAVIGVPDAKWGEAVKACIVLKPGAKLTADDVIAHAKAHIASYKCPKSVDFLDALPRNPSGKILRRALRDQYKAEVGAS